MSKFQKLDTNQLYKYDFQTGDIILFHAKHGMITKLIQCWTKSRYSHIGMVIKDPDFPDFKKKGLFLIESTTLESLPDAEDHVMKHGVQIHDLNKVFTTYPGDSYWRQLHCERDLQFYKRLRQAHAIVHDKPYDEDPEDWIEIAFKDYKDDLRTEKRFICSALVSFLLVSLGVIDRKTPWSVIEPCDFGTEKKVKQYPFRFLNGSYFDAEVLVGNNP